MQTLASGLVFDLEGTRASVATGDQAAEFLRQHRLPPPSTPPMTEEQEADAQRSLVEQITQGWEEAKVDHGALARATAEQRGRVGRFMSCLDMCPAPERGQAP